MRARTVALRSAAPAFLVSDVGETMRWYRSVLGIDTYPFPKTPPHVFGILAKGGVEIMLQRLEELDVAPRRLRTAVPAGSSDTWHRPGS